MALISGLLLYPGLLYPGSAVCCSIVQCTGIHKMALISGLLLYPGLLYPGSTVSQNEKKILVSTYTKIFVCF